MARSAGEPGELTVDQLAATVGMTVRNVRAYAARGLLPPPRLIGRTGWYGPDHVARLTLVRELLDEGFTLAAVERTLDSASSPASSAALTLHRSLMAPWLPEQPEEMDLSTLAARSGSGTTPEQLVELEALGVLEVLDDTRVRVLDPTLLSAGLQVVRLGVAPEAVIAAQKQVVELVEQAAEVYVQMFRTTVWQDFLDAGSPPADWSRLQNLVASLPPVAAQALLASFRAAMAAAVGEEVDAIVGAAPRGEVGGGAS